MNDKELFVVNSGVFKRVAAAFTYLGVYMDGSGTIAMQKEMGDFILKKAKELVPVRTGALRSSGRVVMSQNRKSVEVRFGSGRVKYAMVVEYGRFSHAPFAPRPYIRPAVRYMKHNYKAGKQLKKAVKVALPRVFI